MKFVTKRPRANIKIPHTYIKIVSPVPSDKSKKVVR